MGAGEKGGWVGEGVIYREVSVMFMDQGAGT